MNQIRIHLGESGWLATYQGPHAEQIRAAFGQDTIPTIYTSGCPIGVVIAELRVRNPGARVVHWLEA
jgi:hypothetical protein